MMLGPGVCARMPAPSAVQGENCRQQVSCPPVVHSLLSVDISGNYFMKTNSLLESLHIKERIRTVISIEKSGHISLWWDLLHSTRGTCTSDSQGPGESRGWRSSPGPASCVTPSLSQLIRIPTTYGWEVGTWQALSVDSLHAFSSKQLWGEAELECHVTNQTCSDNLGKVTCLVK